MAHCLITSRTAQHCSYKSSVSYHAAGPGQHTRLQQPRFVVALAAKQRNGQQGQRLICGAASPVLSSFRLLTIPTGLPAVVLPTFLVSLGACWFDRPRGWADHSLIEVAHSYIHERGVFAKEDLLPGSTLGTYPGRPRSSQAMAAKAQYAPACKSYAFRTTNGTYMDPTDLKGQASRHPWPGLPWVPVDPILAFVNEPPPGKLTNVSVVDGRDDLELVFVVTTTVQAGEELFVDYGTSFDRSHYG